MINDSCIGNLAALDCYVTIDGTAYNSAYSRTYQDKIDVNHLDDDMFFAGKSLNLDKIFNEPPDGTSPDAAFHRQY